MSLVTPLSGQVIEASHIAQLTGLVAGASGSGQNVRLTQMTNASDYTNIFGNVDTTNGLIAKFIYGDPGGTPTTVMTVAKTGVTIPATPFRLAGTSTPGLFGGLSVGSSGEILGGDIAASMVGPGNSQFTINYIQPTDASRVLSYFDTTVRGGPSTDASCSQFVLASGKLANRSSASYTPLADGPGVTRCVDVRMLDAGWSGLVAAPNTNLRWGVSVGYENVTATHDDTGAHANEKVAFIALADGNAASSPQFVDSPTSNGTRPNCAFYAGGGGGASNPGGGTFASATTCAFEWPFYAAGTSNTSGIFCVYQDGRTGIAMVPLIATRSGMLQINQDGNHDAGAGLRLWKNASTTNYASIFDDTNNALNLAVRGSGLAGADLLLSASAAADALTIKVNGAAVFAIDTAGIPSVVAANSGTGAGGAAATLGNVSASAATGPTTTARAIWIKHKVGSTQYWLAGWT